MEKRITYPLSKETKPEYQKALQKVAASKKKKGKVVGVEIEEVAPGQFAGVIVMEEPLD